MSCSGGGGGGSNNNGNNQRPPNLPRAPLRPSDLIDEYPTPIHAALAIVNGTARYRNQQGENQQGDNEQNEQNGEPSDAGNNNNGGNPQPDPRPPPQINQQQSSSIMRATTILPAFLLVPLVIGLIGTISLRIAFRDSYQHWQSSLVDLPVLPSFSNRQMTEVLISAELVDDLLLAMGNDTEISKANDTTSITLQYRQDWKRPMMYLEPTFDGYHDFSEDGPRERPFSLGHSISELLENPDTIGDKPVNVSFFRNKGAYYAAAWLSTTEAFLTNPYLNFEAIRNQSTVGWNLEAATWVGVRDRDNRRTINMLDFFVHHLSRYKGRYSVRGPDQEINWQLYLSGLERMQHAYEERPFNNPNLDRNGRVLVICPFHGASDRHSGQDEKQLHLNVTVKALARVFPNIVITVCNEANLEYVTKKSGLNEYLYDVLLVKNLSMAPIVNCIHLPFLSNLHVRRLLEQNQNTHHQERRYPIDHFLWVYYTESDQPPHLTNLNAILQETLHNRRTVVVPHRSHPVALAQELNVSLAGPTAQNFVEINRHKALHNVEDLRDYSCCFGIHQRTSKNAPTKTDWESPEIQLFRQYSGHAQATGVCNPFRLTCITCSFRSRNSEGHCE